MIKLYIFYFVLGGFMLFNSWLIWYFSNFSNGDNIVTYSAFFFSAALFLVVPGLMLYYAKQAAIVGIIALLVMFPFGIHWLVYRYTYEQPLLQGAFNQLCIIATVLYFVSVFYTVKSIIINKRSAQLKLTIKKPVKILLVVLPALLTVVVIIWALVNP